VSTRPDGASGAAVAALRAEVAARRAVDDREEAAIGLFIAALDRLANPLDQAADPVHVTGSAIVTGPTGVLLHLHKRLGLWLQPGGHLEPGEAPWEAAIRETAEETGLVLAHRPGPGDRPVPVHIDVHDGGRGHTHLDVRYLLESPAATTPTPAAGESKNVRWFGWDEAIGMADPGLRGALVALRPERPPTKRPAGT
jgi:8-oxo-dGTP pyrophosphatase MutT (NUDIX family)